MSAAPSPSERGSWKKDRPLYGRHPFLLQPAYTAVAIYRFGRWTLTAPRLVRGAAHAVYFVLYSVVRLATGIDLPRGARFGPGLLIHHFGGIIVHPGTRVGSGCTMRHGVTLGARAGTGAPVIGDNVTIGAYAQVLGDIVVGDGATIGAMTLALKDVPAGAVAVGVPARILGASEAPGVA